MAHDAIVAHGRKVVAASPSGIKHDKSGVRARLSHANVKLADGGLMPLVGFGTWQLEGEPCTAAVKHALTRGYRHIDTAQSYQNEAEVGKAIAESEVTRGEIFLATKLSETEDYRKDRVAAVFKEQLRQLRTDYVDLYMLHGPEDAKLNLEPGGNLRNYTIRA